MLRTNLEDIKDLPTLVKMCEEKLQSRYLFLAELKEIDEALIRANKELDALPPQQTPADETTSLLASDREQKEAAVKINIDALSKPKIEKLLAETGRLLHEAAAERKIIPNQKINSEQPADTKTVFRTKDKMIDHMLQITSGFLTIRDLIHLAKTSAYLNNILRTIPFTQRCLVINKSSENILLFNPQRIMPEVKQTYTGLHKLLEEARKKDPSLTAVKEEFVLQRNRDLVERTDNKALFCVIGASVSGVLLICVSLASTIKSRTTGEQINPNTANALDIIALVFNLTMCGAYSVTRLRDYIRNASQNSIVNQRTRTQFDNDTQSFFSSAPVIPESKQNSQPTTRPESP